MHILVVPSRYPRKGAYSQDFLGRAFRDHAMLMFRKGCKVGVIRPEHRSLKRWRSIFTGPYGISCEDDGGIPTMRWHDMRWFPHSHHANSQRWIRQGLRLYRRYVSEYGTPDIIRAQCVLYAGVLACTIKKHYGVPYVLTEHDTSYARNLIQKKQMPAAREAVNEAACLRCVSPPFCSLLDDFFQLKRGSWKFLPPMVATEFLNSPIRQPHEIREGFKFLCIASLRKVKAVDILIRAFSISFKGVQSVALRIGGDGPERGILQTISEKHGVADQIDFLGNLSRSRVIEEMTAANCFVLPSRIETFGVVLIEALAMGLPIIATRCGGPESIVRPDNGILLNVDDVQGLAAALIRMRERQDEYDSSEIRKRCIDRFGEASIFQHLIDMFQEGLANHESSKYSMRISAP